jgi:hypothetical protein
MKTNSKSEILNPRQTQNHKLKTLNLVVWDFEFGVLDLFRV